MSDERPLSVVPGGPLASLRGDWNGRARGYLILAALGLIGTWWFNARTFGEIGFFAGWPWPPGVLSITVDLLIVAIAGCIFIIVQSQRLGMRHAWVFVLGSLVTAIAFTFPLFLAFRERRLSHVQCDACQAGADGHGRSS